MQKQKKIPERQCMGCNERYPKSTLIRVVRSPEGEISLDLTGKKSGRGAYICKDPACLAKAKRSKRIERTLECDISDELYSKMEEELRRGE